MKNDKKEAMKVELNFGQDKEEQKAFNKDVKTLLNAFKKTGLISGFEMGSRRKCDWCEKTLNKGDKFKTIGEKDMCEDCQKRGCK
jgi:hypothetical protein